MSLHPFLQKICVALIYSREHILKFSLPLSWHLLATLIILPKPLQCLIKYQVKFHQVARLLSLAPPPPSLNSLGLLGSQQASLAPSPLTPLLPLLLPELPGVSGTSGRLGASDSGPCSPSPLGPLESLGPEESKGMLY